MYQLFEQHLIVIVRPNGGGLVVETLDPLRRETASHAPVCDVCSRTTSRARWCPEANGEACWGRSGDVVPINLKVQRDHK